MTDSNTMQHHLLKCLSRTELNEIIKNVRTNQTKKTNDDKYNKIVRIVTKYVLKERRDKHKNSANYRQHLLKMNNRKMNNYDKNRVLYSDRTTYTEDMALVGKLNRKMNKTK